MSNPFLSPSDEGGVSGTSDADDDRLASLVIGMRFPHLLLGGLYALGSLALLGFGGIAFLGGSSPTMGSNEAMLVRGIGALYAVMGAMALLPSGLLLRSGLAALMATGDPEQVEVSLRTQLWFWRVLALYVLGTTALYALGFFAFVIAGVLGAL